MRLFLIVPTAFLLQQLHGLFMNDQQLLRYSRHILLDEIDIEGQEKLLAANVLIIGAGGLGSPAAYYLSLIHI